MIADRQAETGPWFSIEVVPAREEVRVQAIGELDLAATPSLHEHVGDLLTAGFEQVVVDLRRVTFIDLTGVRLLLKLAREADNDGWELSLVGVGGQVRQMLTLTGALGRLPIRTPMVELPALAGA
jgi:anti-sigma B factor antagonist